MKGWLNKTGKGKVPRLPDPVKGPYLFLLRRAGTSCFYLYEIENIGGD